MDPSFKTDTDMKNHPWLPCVTSTALHRKLEGCDLAMSFRRNDLKITPSIQCSPPLSFNVVNLWIAFLLPDDIFIVEKHNSQVTSHLNPKDRGLCLCKENHLGTATHDEMIRGLVANHKYDQFSASVHTSRNSRLVAGSTQFSLRSFPSS